MKFVNACCKPLAYLMLCVSLAVLLTACGAQQVKTVASDGDEQFQLLGSLDYLPVATKGDDGKYLPYEKSDNPYITRSRINKGSVAAFIEARKAFKAKNYDLAEERLIALAKADDSISGPWVMLGDIALEKGESQKALDYFAKAFDVNDKNINALLRIAYVQRLQGQFMAAQNTYVQLLALWPDSAEAHLNLAVLYDLYLNLPIRAQKHMEAYLYLHGEENAKVVSWLQELQGRTGLALGLPLEHITDTSLLVAK